MTDQELDKKFREAATKAHYPYQAEDWDKMVSLLDKPVSQKPLVGWWLKGTGLALIILGLFLAGWYGGMEYARSSQGNRAGSSPSKNSTQLESGAFDSTDATTTASLGSAEIDKSSISEVQSNEMQSKEVEAKEVESKEVQSRVASIAAQRNGPQPTKKITSIKSSANSLANGKLDQSPNGIASERESTELQSSQENGLLISDESTLAEQESQVNSSVPSVIAEKESAQDTSTLKKVMLPESSSIIKSIDSTDTRSPFMAIRLLAGADVSSIGYFKAGKPGLNVGLITEFFLLKKLSLAAGVIWDTKHYVTTTTEYYKTTVIDGRCRMIEIPVSVQWYVRQRGNKAVYLSAGASSYIMSNEYYDYSVKYPNGSYYDYSKEIVNKNRDWFKIMNIGIGIERPIFKNWNLVTEPYLRLPLKPLGELDLQLVSAGLNFQFKYIVK